MEKNFKHFEDTEENKLIYTTIHKEYVRFQKSHNKYLSALIFEYIFYFKINLVEAYIENELKKRIENFSMEVFMKDLGFVKLLIPSLYYQELIEF